jgi:TRAP-type C4-dicarboxylate transport system permease small subunit
MDKSTLFRIGRKIEAGVQTATKSLSRFGGGLLIIMMLLVSADAVSRYVFNNSIKGVLDVVELALVFVVFLTLGEVAVRKGHVAVDLVTSQMPVAIQLMLKSITSFAGFIIVLLIAWRLGVRGWVELIDPTQYTENLEIRVAPFILVAALGSFILAIVLLIDFFNYLFLYLEKKNANAQRLR